MHILPSSLKQLLAKNINQHQQSKQHIFATFTKLELEGARIGTERNGNGLEWE